MSLRTKNIAPSLLFKLRPSCQYVSSNLNHFVASVANYSKYSKIQSRICRIVPLFYKTIILEVCKLQVRFSESKLFFGKSYPKLCLHTFKLKGLEWCKHDFGLVFFFFWKTWIPENLIENYVCILPEQRKGTKKCILWICQSKSIQTITSFLYATVRVSILEHFLFNSFLCEAFNPLALFWIVFGSRMDLLLICLHTRFL